jgi:hypothetical protein
LDGILGHGSSAPGQFSVEINSVTEGSINGRSSPRNGSSTSLLR